jgi:hypothetical protein
MSTPEIPLSNIKKPDFFKVFDSEFTEKNPKFVIESRDLLDRNPMMALASHGFTREITSILEADPSINLLENNKFGENILYFAIKNRQWNLLGSLAERPEIANRGVYSHKHQALFQYLNAMALNEDVEFYENLWENTGLKPQVDILGTSLMRYQPSLSLMGNSRLGTRLTR